MLLEATYRQVSQESGISLVALNRIVEDARKRIPNLDELRKLSLTLKKCNSNVYDAKRASKLSEKLNEFGNGLDQLEKYVELTEKISSKTSFKAADFVGSAIRLVQPEQKAGKVYQDLMKDFEKKLSKVLKLKAKKHACRIPRRGGSKARDLEGRLEYDEHRPGQAWKILGGERLS